MTLKVQVFKENCKESASKIHFKAVTVRWVDICKAATYGGYFDDGVLKKFQHDGNHGLRLLIVANPSPPLRTGNRTPPVGREFFSFNSLQRVSRFRAV